MPPASENSSGAGVFIVGTEGSGPDVYKRQTLQCVARETDKKRNASDAQGLYAVSYTHLEIQLVGIRNGYD